jgi:hypothetical protein
MGHLFLDIETYAAEDDASSALNPYHDKSKVIVISYNYYEGFRPPVAAQIKPPTFLKEWESNEKAVLSEFVSVLRKLKQHDQHLKIHGFNIHKFDLPYLFGRIVSNGIAGTEETHDMLFRPFGHDMMQLSALISNETRAKEQLWGIGQTAANTFFGIQTKEGTGIQCSRHYDAKEYDKIIKYCSEEFTFEQLLNSFYLYARQLGEGRGH